MYGDGHDEVDEAPAKPRRLRHVSIGHDVKGGARPRRRRIHASTEDRRCLIDIGRSLMLAAFSISAPLPLHAAGTAFDAAPIFDAPMHGHGRRYRNDAERCVTPQISRPGIHFLGVDCLPRYNESCTLGRRHVPMCCAPRESATSTRPRQARHAAVEAQMLAWLRRGRSRLKAPAAVAEPAAGARYRHAFSPGRPRSIFAEAAPFSGFLAAAACTNDAMHLLSHHIMI